MESKSISSLTRRSDFSNLKENGRKSQSCRWFFCVYLPNKQEKLRLGLTVSRQVGSSVVRNRLKRWCREFVRKKSAEKLLAIDINIVFRPQDENFYKSLNHSELDDKLGKVWKDIVKNI